MAQYRSPPVVEVVCEFRFSSKTEWNDTLADRFHAAVRETFPERDRIVEHQFEFEVTPDKSQSKKGKRERPVFLTPDRRMFIQFGERIVSIHCLKPYPSWEKFRPIIEQVYRALSEATEIKGIDRIGLLYVDKNEIPGTEIDLTEYFKFRPVIEGYKPESFVNFLMGVDLPFAGQRDLCRLQLTRAVAEREGYSTFLLTSDYFLRKRQGISPAGALSWLEEAHSAIKDIFKNCITERLEQLFNGEV